MPSNHPILCHPLLFLPSIFPSIRVFSNESVLCIRWPKYWSFSFNISPSSEHPGLISFRMDWLDLPAVQGTLKSLLQQPQCKRINSLVLSFLYSPLLPPAATCCTCNLYNGFPRCLNGKEFACNAGDLGSIPGSGRSPEEGNGYPLQNSCLGNPTDRGAWWATVHGFPKESDAT